MDENRPSGRKRREQRVKKPLRVWVSGLDLGGHPFEQSAKVVDISRQGARLDGIHCLRGAGEVIEVKHGFKKARFRIIWIDTTDGQAGICAVEPDKCIWGSELPPPGKLGPQPPQQAVTEPPAAAVAEPITVGAEKPLPLAEQPKPEPVSVEQTFTMPEPPKPQPRQERKYARLRCVIRGSIRADGEPHPFEGTVTRLSLAGCFMESPSPLKRFAKVELSMSGIESKLTGTVRYIAPGQGVGVMFADLDDNVRHGLQRLLAGLSQGPQQKKNGEDFWKD